MSKKKKSQNSQQTVTTSHEKEQQRDYLRMENYGVYFAKVVSIEKEQIVLKDIVAKGIRHDGIQFMGSEDHINIFSEKDINTIKEQNIYPGCRICFTAYPYQYTRKNKSTDFSLCEISNVEIVSDYHIPTREELIDEQIKNLVCEVCLFNNQCYFGMCVVNQNEVKEKFNILKNLQPGKFTPLTVIAAYEIWGKVFSQLGGFQNDKDNPYFQTIEKIKQLSSKYGTGYIWPVHDALAHMVYPEFPRIYYD